MGGGKEAEVRGVVTFVRSLLNDWSEQNAAVHADTDTVWLGHFFCSSPVSILIVLGASASIAVAPPPPFNHHLWPKVKGAEAEETPPLVCRLQTRP